MKTLTTGKYFNINGHYGFPVIVQSLDDAMKIATEQIDIFQEGLIQEKVSADIYCFYPDGGSKTYFQILDFAE